jgi:hypothetical protein
MLITAITNVTQNVKNHIEKRKARREGGKSKTSTCTWPSVGTTVTAENVNELLKSRTQDDKGFRSCSCTTTGLSENQQDLVNTTAPDPRVVENSGLGPCRCAETYEKLRASLSNKLNRQSTIVEEKPLKSCACASTNTEPPKEEAKAESGGEPPAESTKEGSVKGESQAESTKRESKAESVKEELQESVIGEPLAESSRRESKAESVKGESQAESTKRESKAESMKGESQSESIKRDSKADSTKRESKAESTKQESKAESIKEEPQAESTKRESKADESKAEAPVEAPPQDEPKPEPEPEPPKEEAAPEPQTEQSEPPAEAEPEAEAPPKDVSVVDKAKDVDVTGQVAAGVGSPGVTPEVEHLPEASPIPDQTSKINSPASRKSSDKAKPQPLPKDCRRGLNTSDLYKIPPFKDKMSADMGRGPSLPKDCRRGLSEFKDAPVRDKHLTSDDLARGRSKDCRRGKMNALGSDIPEKKHDSLVGTKVKPVDCKCKDCQERRGSAQAANRPCAASLAKDPKECLKECPKQKVAQPGKVKMTVVHRSVPKLNAGLN